MRSHRVRTPHEGLPAQQAMAAGSGLVSGTGLLLRFHSTYPRFVDLTLIISLILPNLSYNYDPVTNPDAKPDADPDITLTLIPSLTVARLPHGNGFPVESFSVAAEILSQYP